MEESEGKAGRGSGLARERTALAWNRSGLAVAVTVVIVLRRLWPLHGGKGVLALALIAFGASAWVMGMYVGHFNRSLGSKVTAGQSAYRWTTIGTLLLAVAAVLVSIL